MPHDPILTTVMGSHPFPGWLEHAAADLNGFGPDDLDEMRDDAAMVAIGDMVRAGLDTISDGEQTRFDFNLSFYAFLEGIALETHSPRRFGPPAHDQRGKHEIVGELMAPRGLGVVDEYERLARLAPEGPNLKASIPGPYTLAGRLIPNERYPDRHAITEALVPLVAAELDALVEAGCRYITVDEPSMSCYAYREDTRALVDIFNRTVEGIVGRCHVSTHLCFGNFKGRAVAPRSYAPMFPDFLDLTVDEIHVEMASREFSELDVIAEIGTRRDVAVGVIDVKSYYIETPEDVADRVAACLKFVAPEQLTISPDCGLSQTARWAAVRKLTNMVAGAELARSRL